MNNDLFIYDTERFKSIALDNVLEQGLFCFTEHCVIALNKQDNTLIAQVQETNNSHTTHQVTLSKDTGTKLNFQCSCDAPKNTACQHAIAALHSYTAYDKRYKNLIDTSAAAAIQSCVEQGNNEVRTKLISGNLGFGTWQATATILGTQGLESYQVHIRSLTKPFNYCTCPDLNLYRLGTCKHIEAVLHYVQSKPDYNNYLGAGIPVSFVYMAWENNKPIMRLHALSSMSDNLSSICAGFFGPNKNFNGNLPEDFFRYTQQVQGRDDLHIGEDALQYAQQSAKNAAYKERAKQINDAILNTHGVIPDIKARLLPYQIDGVAFLATHGRALLADDTGLGKTLQAITAASWLVNHAAINKILIVCPASLTFQWAREIKKFTAYTVQIIQGNAEQRAVQYQSDALFFIINYELAMRDITLITDDFNADLLVVDEPQRSKNWRTRITPKLKLIPSQYVFVLSGIIVENRLDDLYSLLQLVDPTILAPFWRYLLDYQITDETGTVLGYRDLAQLLHRIAPVMLRRQHQTVSTQLLEKTEVRLDIPLDKKQRELHDSGLSTAKQLAQLATRRTLTPGEQHRLLAALQQARMACNAAGLVDNETHGSPKLHELSYLLEDLCLQNNHKTVIFSQWAVMTEMVEALTRQIGLSAVRLHGGMSSDTRTDAINRFKNDDSVQVLISTDAGSVGLNLKSATVLINLDMPWNPAILEQRTACLHRPGQKNTLQVFLMLAEDSYEQQVTKLVKNKRDLFDNVISPETSKEVVGVSKKMLQTLINTLISNTTESNKHQNIKPSHALAASNTQHSDTGQSEPDPQLQQLLTSMQLVFKYRLQSVVGSPEQILVIVNPIHNSDEDTVRQLSKGVVPIAVVDTKTLNSLKGLEACSTLATLPVLYKQSLATTINPLTQMAEAKLHSAETLLAQHCVAGVLDLIASAMLLQAAAIAGQFQAPAIDTVTVWLHNEILPQQLLTPAQADAIIRVVSLLQSPDVPLSLIEQAITDAKLFC